MLSLPDGLEMSENIPVEAGSPRGKQKELPAALSPYFSISIGLFLLQDLNCAVIKGPIQMLSAAVTEMLVLPL